MKSCNNILLYGCEIWAESLEVNQRPQKLLTALRFAYALGVKSAYRTLSAAVDLVIADRTTLDLQVDERIILFKARQNIHNDTFSLKRIKEKWQLTTKSMEDCNTNSRY